MGSVGIIAASTGGLAPHRQVVGARPVPSTESGSTADPLFIAAAESHGEHAVGIVLRGYAGDGAEGLPITEEHGGAALVQKPEKDAQPSIPWAAILADRPAACPSVEAIADPVSALWRGQVDGYAADSRFVFSATCSRYRATTSSGEPPIIRVPAASMLA